ncbi:DUF4386 domain-containing protein [Paenibacillus methanolicus]|uniref:Uncharacterized protein DUF4386 n=1 Tax=Paenibacillus methanolicus TaxID=582686 RepID=A0A5S5C2J1_9BACL|nr:DUF4386 domain-containing protein [Paenibacillus methanolicus]TYP73379.1 uncharacterized protein DUF4386 [Paenibacillus methanolicus]
MKWMARVAGALFLVSTAAYLIGSGLLNPVLQQSEFLEGLAASRTNIVAGLLLELINAIAVLGIGMLLYPILRKHHEAFSLGYFGSRIIESAILIISLAGPLVLIALGDEYAAAEASDRSYLQAIANAAADAHYMLFELAMAVLSIGSLLFCYVLYRSKLVPRVLSAIGFIGYGGLLTSSCLAIAGIDTGAVLYIPGAIFEIVLPLWLLIKGVDPRAEKS